MFIYNILRNSQKSFGVTKLLHPYSQEQKIAQIQANKANSTSKQSSNIQRGRLQR